MKITMLEPLGVSSELINELAQPLMDAGHTFTPCFEAFQSEEDKKAAAKDADILIIANAPLSKDVITASPSLEYISVAFTGVDHVDADACRANNIKASNAQGYCTHSVAEVTLGLILNVLRNVTACDAVTRKGGTKAGLVGNELYGKKVGIVGTGAIGRQVGTLLKAFNCELYGYDVYENDAAKELGIQYVSLETLMKESDIVTLHTPLTAETKGLINQETIGLMKETAILINCARGPVVDSEALADALNNDKIAGAGIDVYEVEPPVNTDHPLLTSKNTVVTPHIAFATKESIDRRATITFENIYKWLEKTPQNVLI